MARSSSKGFFQVLFDFSFTEFITPRIVGVIYAIVVALLTLAALGIIFSSLPRGIGATIGALIVAPLFFLLYVLFFRVVLESMVAAMYTANNTAQIAENTRPRYQSGNDG
ncbi:MAG: DUF4282 domain-containing protein [Leptolyngbyaceae cyanobacterium bins.302]|nr:DUF4282 domain-containing protein [Leptolyngbyaceae cyanobacterium bins.302]